MIENANTLSALAVETLTHTAFFSRSQGGGENPGERLLSVARAETRGTTSTATGPRVSS